MPSIAGGRTAQSAAVARTNLERVRAPREFIVIDQVERAGPGVDSAVGVNVATVQVF